MRLLIAALIAVLFVGEAAAQSCNSLRKQLAAAQSGGGDMASLRSQYKAYRCDASTRYGRNRACAGIEARMARAGSGRQVAALQRQVQQACAPSRVATRREPAPRESTMMIGGRVVTGVHTEGKRNRGIFSSLFGNSRSREEVRVVSTAPANGVERLDLNSARPNRAASGGGETYVSAATRSSGHVKGQMRVGNYRTVCVRLCDGFYFPINSRSHSDNFYDELAMCIGRCPGADVSLYAHGSDSPVESMRSTMTGERYVTLPTAFAYRKRSVSGCGCQPMSTGSPDEKVVDSVVASLKADEQTASDAPAPEIVEWTPFKAVYDETGKPLPPLKTDRTSEAPTRLTGLTLPDAPRRVASNPTMAMEGDHRYRDVGPQFFSKYVSEPAVAQARPKTTGMIATTAVTVIPLGTTTPRSAAPRATTPVASSTAPSAASPVTPAAADAEAATLTPAASGTLAPASLAAPPATEGDAPGPQAHPATGDAPAGATTDAQQEARGPLEGPRGG
ncbi:DUF2865 domain-containing protein [Acuticoccus sp. I52.16.1]|uniref:DUF2865 domain-containing protein n=1 Tax=Acuticoccus sp. I52.16.1 TaxID=2928472 RepID=UPI001FD120DD|nr:DUF2865 domain-containing protein [Acuticoccus sp. I52.16.1]UOM33655.1 DUF2865 domain-containing protein [Acuticoccus sp. I52.16.1]